MNSRDVVKQIKNLEHFRDTNCPKCSVSVKVQKLEIYRGCY